MADAKGGYAVYGDTGEGHYGMSLGKQNDKNIRPVRDRILDLVKTIPFTAKDSVFSIGDYGTSDGAASMSFIRDLIVTLREHHGPEVPFQVIYEDQAINDFNSLFKRLSGIISDPPSYLLELDNVFSLASGTEFRKQCVPSESMHFIMSVNGAHWLSRCPVKYKDSLYIYPDSTAEEKEALNQQALSDWETFLLMRSKELKHGGILWVVMNTEHVDRNEMIMLSGKSFLYLLIDIWKSFCSCSKITCQEFSNTNFAACWYTLKQVKTPFEHQNTPVSKSGLRLLSAETFVNTCIFYNAWREKKDLKGIDDRREFAREFVEAHRNWSHNVFLTGLSEHRTQQEKRQIVDDLYHMVEERMGEMDPEEFKNDQIFTYVIIEKE